VPAADQAGDRAGSCCSVTTCSSRPCSPGSAAAQFPSTADELAEYDVVVLSDIGANSIQLAPSVFERASYVTGEVVTAAGGRTAI
jgi:hypothetical protein